MAADCMIVVLGDSPRLPSGLARIASDITERLYANRLHLGIEVLQVGWEYGALPLKLIPWPLATFADIGQDWAESQVMPLIADASLLWGIDPQKIVLLTVWDPARCFTYRNAGVQKWGYFAVDGHNQNGSFGGPAAETVRAYDRVLAYTEYGAKVLHDVIARDEPVSYLPHGHTWGDTTRWAAEQVTQPPPPPKWRLGCVATNQPRKDLNLFFATLAWLREHGEDVYGWLHTDELVTAAWSIPELLEVHGVSEEWCLISSGQATDEWLQAMYTSCAVTLAPGRGEGFGYPIVESYAMGRPVVHAAYGGGAELTLPEGRITPYAFDVTNPYVIQRPLLQVGEVGRRCLELAHKMLLDPTLAPFYAGSVAHLHWDQLWPRWESWIRQGLKQVRTRADEQVKEVARERE